MRAHLESVDSIGPFVGGFLGVSQILTVYRAAKFVARILQSLCWPHALRVTRNEISRK
jgi:hypothetical protein